MFSIISGALVISLLHAVIPNHWLPVIAIGRKEQWSLRDTTFVTLISALAHGLSTILLGYMLSFLGAQLADKITYFTHLIAPSILVILGIFFIYRHHTHNHFKVSEEIKQKKSRGKIITALVIAMFFSPCLEIEALFLLAGAHAKWFISSIALMYLIITTSGMVLLVRFAYRRLLTLNWHALEHNVGIITGLTLIITGIVTFFIS